jgi:outer membrane protein assembly factor BamE
MKSRQFFTYILLILIVTLSACVYRQDILQGNRIDDKKLVQLEIGMNKVQVEFLLGAPALIDSFHPENWYYIQFLKLGNSGDVDKRVMILKFDKNLLKSIEGSLSDIQLP